ncbi:hypothetical protein NBRC116585_26200 [Thalassolituus maritimus]|uniref:Uncharacterized protein n=2 Tax=Thalassolituus maritimus TaxID=484498 RepID=A0ABQ0A286_9GAMM
MVFLIALAMALRLMRTAPSLLAIASHNPVFGLKQDLARALAIIPAFYLASAGFELEFFLWVAVFGEVIATILGFWLVRGLLGSELTLYRITGLYLYFLVFVICMFFASNAGGTIWIVLVILLFSWLVFIGILFVIFRSLLESSLYIIKKVH